MSSTMAVDEGASVDTDGAKVGFDVAMEGDGVGSRVGDLEGARVGAGVIGARVGESVSSGNGTGVGDSVIGANEGVPVGAIVGVDVGTIVSPTGPTGLTAGADGDVPMSSAVGASVKPSTVGANVGSFSETETSEGTVTGDVVGVSKESVKLLVLESPVSLFVSINPTATPAPTSAIAATRQIIRQYLRHTLSSVKRCFFPLSATDQKSVS